MNNIGIFAVKADDKEEVMNISPEEQSKLVLQEQEKCLKKMIQDPPWPNDSLYCPRVWDDLLCWPDTQAGTMAEQSCPNYVHGFKAYETATFECQANGTWYFSVENNRTWTNLSLCVSSDNTDIDVIDSRFDIPEFAKEHMDKIRLVFNIGYGISLVSLVLSVIIMMGFKKLHCPRNTIHLNLFFSFILRASVTFMKENLLVKQVGFSFDVDTTEAGVTSFKSGMHWECKLFFTGFYYILGANYMWICAEALYLFLLIHKSIFTERSGIRWYIIFGWGSPLLFMIPWVIVKSICEDVYCWNIHFHEGYFWIMRGPTVLSIVVNFVCFISIVRVLFTKLSAFNSPEANRYRYRKLAKSTLVLIPLFGVHYIIFSWYPTKNKDQTVEVVQLYYDMLFSSIQGFFVALLYCFLNGEVRSEIKKKWQRFQITKLNKFPKGRTNSHNGTMDSTFFSRPRESNASMSLNPECRYHFDNGRAVGRKASLESTHNSSKHSGSIVRNGRVPPTVNAPDEASEPMISMQEIPKNGNSTNI